MEKEEKGMKVGWCWSSFLVAVVMAVVKLAEGEGEVM